MLLVPSAGPSNITAQNTSSSSIIVTWDDVLEEHRNGIIIGYKVYIKKVGSEGGWQTEEMSQKTFSKSGLDLWAFYDIKISAKTSVGEGTQSSIVRVRTDEDGEYPAEYFLLIYLFGFIVTGTALSFFIIKAISRTQIEES